MSTLHATLDRLPRLIGLAVFSFLLLAAIGLSIIH